MDFINKYLETRKTQSFVHIDFTLSNKILILILLLQILLFCIAGVCIFSPHRHFETGIIFIVFSYIISLFISLIVFPVHLIVTFIKSKKDIYKKILIPLAVIGFYICLSVLNYGNLDISGSQFLHYNAKTIPLFGGVVILGIYVITMIISLLFLIFLVIFSINKTIRRIVSIIFCFTIIFSSGKMLINIFSGAVNLWQFFDGFLYWTLPILINLSMFFLSCMYRYPEESTK